MKNFRLTLSHDHGTATLTTTASNLKAAIDIVMNAENCPMGAITKVEELTDPKEEEIDWEFIERYISSNNDNYLASIDLEGLNDGDINELTESAKFKLETEYGGDIDNPQIEEDYKQVLKDLMEEAREEQRKERRDNAVTEALENFWTVIAREYREETQTGDMFPPDLTRFELQAQEIVQKWIDNNVKK
jgi:hypothetical protein